MKRSLNLNVLMEETFDVTAGTQTFHIRKPNEEMVVKLEAMFKEVSRSGISNEEALPQTAVAVRMIMNNNIEGIVIEDKLIATMPIDVRMILIREYIGVIQDINKDPS